MGDAVLPQGRACRWRTEKVVTPRGEIFFRIEADTRTGVIDMHEDRARTPWRIGRHASSRWAGARASSSSRRCNIPADDDFAAQCRGLEQEFPHIKVHLES